MDITHIAQMEAGIAKSKEFAAKYAEAPGMIIVGDTSCLLAVDKADATKAGKVFGKDGWIRSNSWNGKAFDWTKEIDGVRVKIDQAEDNQFNGSPVPEKAFPLEITEA